MADAAGSFDIPAIGGTADGLSLPDNVLGDLNAILGSVPTVVDAPVAILNYASKDDNGESAMLSTRAPLSWTAIINDIITNPRLPFGDVFQTRADFIRWSVMYGIQAAQLYRLTLADADSPNDPIAAAHIFAERTMGMINARSALINRISADVRQMSDALKLVVDAGEMAEAGAMVNYYMNGVADQTDSFWRAMFTKVLFQNDYLRNLIVQLINEGLTQDASLIDYAASLGLVDATLLDQSGDDPEDIYDGTIEG